MKKTWIVTLASMSIFALIPMFAGNAMAGILAPTAGSLFYDVYDLAINNILKGAVGFVIGCALIGTGIWLASKVRLLEAISSVISGILVIKLDSLLTSASAIF